MNPLYRIVLTGGPCGGKTTALSRIRERLESLGFRVFVVPEAATMLFSGGASAVGFEETWEFESSILNVQLALEGVFERLARQSGKPSVMICDRGCMDASAYVAPGLWQAMLDEHGWSVVGLRDRYEAVIHLMTAAQGAEAFYETSAVRTEPPEKACELDARLREAWLGHPHLRVIGNETDFGAKMRRVLETVCHVVGVPQPLEIERKFLVRSAPEKLPVPHQEVEIEQVYLQTGDGSEVRVRRRGQRGNYAYTHTTKRPVKAGQRIEVERPISARDYVAFLSQADPACAPVRKRRTCFLHENQYFELDRFVEPRAGLALLEVELDREGVTAAIPPFIDVERDVTEEAAYSNHAIAIGK